MSSESSTKSSLVVRTMVIIAKFEVEKFDGRNNFVFPLAEVVHSIKFFFRRNTYKDEKKKKKKKKKKKPISISIDRIVAPSICV